MSENTLQPVTLRPYYEALNRLVRGEGTIVPAGTKITLSAVAREAGKSAGSIKKSRPVYASLIREVEQRAKSQLEASAPGSFKIGVAKHKASLAKLKINDLEEKYKAALARELMLLRAWENSERRLRQISNVVPIQPLARP